MFCVSSIFHIQFRSKRDPRKPSPLLFGSFFDRTIFNQMSIFLRNLKVQRAKRNFSGTLGHKILELYNVLVQIRFTTSKTKRYIQYRKLGTRANLLVAKRLKSQILGNKEIIGKFQIQVETWLHGPCPGSTLEIKLLAIAVKKHAKVAIKLFFTCPVLLDHYPLIQIFCVGL